MKKKITNPNTVYSKCPDCGSNRLLRLAVDVLCCSCDWMSTESFVEAGGMDNLISAYNNHFRTHRSEEASRSRGAVLLISQAEQENLSA